MIFEDELVRRHGRRCVGLTLTILPYGTDMARLPRSPLLMNPHDSALLVIDVQAKLVPLVLAPSRLVWNIGRLVEGATLLQVPIGLTEQYPKGLGATVEELRPLLPDACEKTTFSCAECGELFDRWQAEGRRKILVAGMETHVCVQQTTLDLLANGFDVYVAVDAVSARHAVDHQTALGRMSDAGATLTTCESAIFEWCDHSRNTAFRQLSQLIQREPPDDS